MSLLSLPDEILLDIFNALTRRNDLLSWHQVNHRLYSIRRASTDMEIARCFNVHCFQQTRNSKSLVSLASHGSLQSLLDCHVAYLRIFLPRPNDAGDLVTCLFRRVNEVHGSSDNGIQLLESLSTYLSFATYVETVPVDLITRLTAHYESRGDHVTALRLIQAMCSYCRTWSRPKALPEQEVWTKWQYHYLRKLGRIAQATEHARQVLEDLEQVSGPFGPLNEPWAVRVFDGLLELGRNEEAMELTRRMVNASKEQPEWCAPLVKAWNVRLLPAECHS